MYGYDRPILSVDDQADGEDGILDGDQIWDWSCICIVVVPKEEGENPVDVVHTAIAPLQISGTMYGNDR